MNNPKTPAKPEAPERSVNEKSAKEKERWWTRIAIFFAVAAVAGLAFVFLRPDPEVDLAAWLAERDLELNAGFSGHYLPGTVIVTHRRGDDGTPQRLSRPEIYLWPEHCFPGQAPAEAPFPMPQVTVWRATQSGIGAEQKDGVVPTLGVQGAQSWEIEIIEPRLLTFARGDLEERFAEDCLDRLEPLYDAGTDPAWTATILEAVVADGLRITVDWEAKLGAEAKASAARQAEEELEGAEIAAEITVESEVGSGGKTVLEVEGRVVVAYRALAMRAIGEEG